MWDRINFNRAAWDDAHLIERQSAEPEYRHAMMKLEGIAVKIIDDAGIARSGLKIEHLPELISNVPERVKYAINSYLSLRYMALWESRMSLKGRELLEDFYHIAINTLYAGTEMAFLGPEWIEYVNEKQKQKSSQVRGGEVRAANYKESWVVARGIFERLRSQGKNYGSKSNWAKQIADRMPTDGPIRALKPSTLRSEIGIWLSECEEK